MKVRLRFALVAAGFAAASAACDSSTTRTYVTGPSSTAALTATFVQSPATALGATFLGYLGQPCATGALSPTTFALLVSASRRADLSRVSIQLNDGSHLGPTITFPQPPSTAGALRIAAGETRTFTFQPRLSCAAILPAWVAAAVDWIDGTGMIQTATATSPIR
jgi:hypothetical protein